MVVHSVLPGEFAAPVAELFDATGIEHRAHPADDPMRAAERAAGDPDAICLIGPFRSREVAEACEVTAPAGLPLIAPVATWAGVTRDDEPGCDDPARHGGTVIRIPARDTEVARRVAADVRARGQRAYVVAGDHEYGVQIDGQLGLAGLPRAGAPTEADLVVLAGLAGSAEVDEAAALGLPVVAFDGVQGGVELGDLLLALPVEPDVELTGLCRRAAELVARAVAEGAGTRAAMLAALRRLGPFDEHGDPVDPPVWLWRVGPGWSVAPERALVDSPA